MMLVFCCGSASTAKAMENSYSDVLSDLKKDVLFTEAKYPEDTSSTKLEVITLAESVNNELFVYVYSPGRQEATSISLSIDSKNTYFRNYKLQLLNQNGVFYKYKVADFTVASVTERYYEISTIYRAFIADVDEQPDGNNTVSEIGIAVGVAYTFTGSGNDLIVKSTTVEIITVTDKFVGFVRYPNGGFFGFDKQVDVHFVAFSTDMPMDKLNQVDVFYTTQTYSYRGEYVGMGFEENSNFSDITENTLTVDSSKDMEYKGSGWLSYTYKWQSIETASDFVENLGSTKVYKTLGSDMISSTELQDPSVVINKDWVFRFAATSYQQDDVQTGNRVYTVKYGTLVADVLILRLSFETDGNVYNLGVVDNKQTGAVDPDTGLPVPENPDGVDIVPLPNGDGKDGINWLIVAIAVVAVVVVGRFLFR